MTKKVALLSAALLSSIAIDSSAFAAGRPTPQRTQLQQQRAQQQRAQRPRTFIIGQSDVLRRSGTPGAVAQARLRSLKKNATEGYAAYQELVVNNPGAKVETVREGYYEEDHSKPHSDQHQIVKVSGVPGGVLEATHFGTLSTHDLFDSNGDNFRRQVYEERLKNDGMQVSYSWGNSGQFKVLAKMSRSGDVSKNDVKIPLNPAGSTFVKYERLGGVDAQGNGGVVVGGTGGYTMGRLVEIQWDSK